MERRSRRKRKKSRRRRVKDPASGWELLVLKKSAKFRELIHLLLVESAFSPSRQQLSAARRGVPSSSVPLETFTTRELGTLIPPASHIAPTSTTTTTPGPLNNHNSPGSTTLPGHLLLSGTQLAKTFINKLT
ncbi:hypothetical protein J6590_039304 [Homalodisca vitripennis]|nr:hypothetical protein J6590_039304 [Homalodisca vitripennis]